MISYPPHLSAVVIFLWSSLWLYSDMGPCRVCRKTYNSKIVARNDDSSNFHENMGSQSTIFLFKPWGTRCGYLFWPFLTQFSTSCNSELQVFHSQVLATDCRIFFTARSNFSGKFTRRKSVFITSLINCRVDCNWTKWEKHDLVVDYVNFNHYAYTWIDNFRGALIYICNFLKPLIGHNEW